MPIPICPVCNTPHAACPGADRTARHVFDTPEPARRPVVAELHEYEVPRRNSTMRVKMSQEDAELIYGDQAKRVGDARQGEVQDVRRPPWTEPVPAEGESDPKTGERDEKKAPARRNKAASAQTDKQA
jgi:hypothetical protein